VSRRLQVGRCRCNASTATAANTYAGFEGFTRGAVGARDL